VKAQRKSLYIDRPNRRIFFTLSIAILTGMLCAAQVYGDSAEAEADREMSQGHFQNACRLYKLAIATHRSDVSILIKAAQAYEAAGDLDEAIHRAREATVFEPNNADARLALAHFLDANRDEKAAIMQFEMALDVKNAPAETRKAAYGPLLRLLRHQNQFEKLAKTARRGVHEFPQDSDAHYNLAWALSQLPEEDTKSAAKIKREGISEYQKSISLGNKRAAVHLNLAMLLADSGDKKSAEQELSTFLKLAPAEANRTEVATLKKQLNEKQNEMNE